MRDAVIIDAVRSPMAKGKPERDGNPGGGFSSLHPVELLAQTIEGLMDRNDVDPAEVDDVLMGCVSQVGEQAGPVGRWPGSPLDCPSMFPRRRSTVAVAPASKPRTSRRWA